MKGRERNLGTIDLDTGEIISKGVPVYVPAKRQNGFGRWFAMAQDALRVLKQFSRLEDCRVLFALLEKLDYENLITANQAEIARDLGMKRSSVNQTIKRLIAAGAILEGPKVGVSRTYRLNPSFGWKGTAKNHVVELNKHRKDRMKAAGISEVIDGGRDSKTIDMFPEVQE
jgi:DNA-binding transcriptional ArsR family regulator